MDVSPYWVDEEVQLYTVNNNGRENIVSKVAWHDYYICTCEDYYFRGHEGYECKHIRLIKELEKKV
jgi:hypothetical protein